MPKSKNIWQQQHRVFLNSATAVTIIYHPCYSPLFPFSSDRCFVITLQTFWGKLFFWMQVIILTTMVIWKPRRIMSLLYWVFHSFCAFYASAAIKATMGLEFFQGYAPGNGQWCWSYGPLYTSICDNMALAFGNKSILGHLFIYWTLLPQCSVFYVLASFRQNELSNYVGVWHIIKK